jgi:putative transposase
MARRSVKFELTGEQEATLKMWVGSHKTQQRHSRRAQVILLSAQGLTLEEISARSGLNRTNCMKWRKRFAVEGLDGLKDKPRKGRPATITPWQRAQVIRLACERPSNGANAWSRRELARVTGLGSTTVHRILEGASLKPHKVHHWCGRSPDPEFEPKQTDIIGLYLNPPENALIFSLDEKSQIQALDRTQPELPLRPGNPKRHTATYTRHGTTCLLAALAVHEGTVEARCVDSNSRHVFLDFLKRLYRAHPHKHLHVIVDNLPLHKHPEVMEWVSRRRRLTLHFTPTYASWLNQIEIWFHIFSHDVVKGGIWRSKKELVDQIMLYIKRYNRDRAHPFTWTYTGKVLVA